MYGSDWNYLLDVATIGLEKFVMMTFASRFSRVFTFMFWAEHFVIATSAGLLMLFIFCTNQKPPDVIFR